MYNKVVLINDKYPDVYYNLGNALYMLENNDAAIEAYEKAIKNNSAKGETYYNLGNALCIKQEF